MKSQFAAIGFAVLLALFGNWTSSEDRPEAQRPGQHERRDDGSAPEPVPDTAGRTEYDSDADGVVTASLAGRGLGDGVFDGNGPQLVGMLLPVAQAPPVWAPEPEVTLPEAPVWEVPVPVEPVPVEPVPVELPPLIDPVIDPVTGEPVTAPVDGALPDPDVTPVPGLAPIIEDPLAEDPLAEDPPAEDPSAQDPPAEEPLVEEPVFEDPAAPVVPDETAELETASTDGVPPALSMVAVGAL